MRVWTACSTGRVQRLALGSDGLPARKLGLLLITANGRDVEVSFKAQALPEMESGRYDLNTPGRVKRNSLCAPLRKRAIAPACW